MFKQKDYYHELKRKTSYSDEEIEKIVNFLYTLALIEFNEFENSRNYEQESRSDGPCIE